MSDDEIKASIANAPTYLRACCLDTKTTFAVITIPGASRYRDLAQFSQLLSSLTSCGFKPKCYKAADCDDIQIYLAFTEAVDSDKVQTILSSSLSLLGFEISPNTLVVASSDTAFALPLQSGFAWLNDNLSIKLRREDISSESAIALFVSDLARSAVSPSVLLDAIIIPPAVPEVDPFIEDSVADDSRSNKVDQSHWSTILIPDSAPLAVPIELELPNLISVEIAEVSVLEIALASPEPIMEAAHEFTSFEPEFHIDPSAVAALQLCDPDIGSSDRTEGLSTGPPSIDIFEFPGGAKIGAQLLLFPLPPLTLADPDLVKKPRRGHRARSDPEAALQQAQPCENKLFPDLNYVELTIPFPDPGGE